MNVVQLDKSVIRDPLYASHKKKNIKCPTCKTCVFQHYGTPHSSSVQVKYEIELIHHSPCPSSIRNCEKVSSFACPVAVRVHINLGDYCKCVGVKKNKDKKGLNQQIWTNDSAVSNNDDVGYLWDNNVASDGNRKSPTEDSASYSQDNPAEDYVLSNDDVGYDVNNSYELVLDMCKDLAVNAG
jgi:hypothetical protein